MINGGLTSKVISLMPSIHWKMSSISKHNNKRKNLNCHPPFIVVVTSLLRLTLSFKLFMFLINVVLFIDYTGPEINGEHQFTVNIHHYIDLENIYIQYNKFRTHKLGSWSKFRHFSKTLFIWTPKFFLRTPQLA